MVIRKQELHAGDILCFVNDGSFIGNTIENFTGSSITHIGMMIDSENFVESQWSGVRKQHIQKLKNESRRVIVCPLNNFESSLIQKDLAKFNMLVDSRIGQPYDYIQLVKFAGHILSFGLYKPSENNRLNVCSELAGWILENMYIIFNVNTSLMTPQDIYDLPIYKRKYHL